MPLKYFKTTSSQYKTMSAEKFAKTTALMVPENPPENHV
jgi:hypothetical protein